MGDLGVSNRPRESSTREPSTALARVSDAVPGIARKVGRTVAGVDQFIDRVPVITFVTPRQPDVSERTAAGVMAGVYVLTGIVATVPLVGPAIAGAIVGGGGVLARNSPNPDVQNHGNLAMQTAVYGTGASFFGLGGVPHFRAAIKSALIALNRS